MDAPTLPAGTEVHGHRSRRLVRTQHGLDLGISRIGQHVVVDLAGSLDGSSALFLDHILDDLIVGQGNRHLDIDLSGVEEFDSAGLAVVSWAVQRSIALGIQLSLEGVPASAEALLSENPWTS